MFENRRYVIIPTSELTNVDFSQILETSIETCRYSIDETKSLVKYEGDQPESITTLVNKSQEYSHAEILIILATEEWSVSNDVL